VKRGICFLPDAPSLAPFETWELSNPANTRDAENVDEGPNPAAIHQSFMKSPQPRANILDPDMDSAGIGIAERNGQLFAGRFLQGEINGNFCHDSLRVQI
jgi:hypothetical protein